MKRLWGGSGPLQNLGDYQQLVEKFGISKVGAIGGVGAFIGMSASLKVIALAKKIIPSLRNILETRGSKIAPFLIGIPCFFGTTFVEKIVLKTFGSIIAR